MKIIFLTLSRIQNIESRGIYNDLMRKFRNEGHEIFIVSPLERKLNLQTSVNSNNNVNILGIKTLNIQKTNFIEKGLGTILIESQFKSAIKKYWSNVKFDLIIYSTPPITFPNVIKYLKKKNHNATTYLLLKDIFPQNAVDLGMFSKNSFFYKFFRKKETKLYLLSDFIGCMSPANVKYILANNPKIDSQKVEVAPNSIELNYKSTNIDKIDIRTKYNLPLDKPIFIYGGNLGKPQDIDFLIRCLEINKERTDCHFLIIGDGTEYNKLAEWHNSNTPDNCSLFKKLPKEYYDNLVQACDIGLIFLDHNFTIPNYPSRLLSYLEYKMPIIAATDSNTDIGKMAVTNGYGYWCESVNPHDFTALVDTFIKDPKSIKTMGLKGHEFLLKNYLVGNTYDTIIKHIKVI